MRDALQQRLEVFGLDERAAARLEPLADSLSVHLEAAMQRFATSHTLPMQVRFLYGRERIEADGGGPLAHWHSLLAGQIDASFAEASRRTGQRFARLGLDLQWHSSGHAIIAQSLIRGVIHDGLAAILRPRRGPLGLIGAPDLSAARDFSDAMANGIAALVGAIIFDLDLTYAGFAEKLQEERVAVLASERARLDKVVAAAGRMLESAVEGCSEIAPDAEVDAAVAPLRDGAAKLADRVAQLIADLETAGEATEKLAGDVLSGAAGLVKATTVRGASAGQLFDQSQAAIEAADALVSALGGHARHLRAMGQRLGKLSAEVADHNDQNAGFEASLKARRQATDQIDALGLAANLLMARQGLSASDAGQDMSLSTDLQALATGLSRLATQMRLDDERQTQILRDSQASFERLASGHQAFADETSRAHKAAKDASMQSKVLKGHLDTVDGLACGLRDQLAQGGEATQQALEQIGHALTAAGALVDLAGAFGDDEGGVEPGQSQACLVPDETALAAHWHAV